MRTNELRTELRQLADEMAPFEADLYALRQHERRRQTVLRVAAAVTTVVVIAAAFVAWQTQRRPSVAGHQGKQRALVEMPRVDVAVIPATDEVRQMLERSPLVGEFAPVGGVTSAAVEAAGMNDLGCALNRESGFAVAAATRSPESLADSLGAELGSSAHVYQVSRPGDLEIFMKVDASTEEVVHVRNDLFSDPQVAATRFLNHNEAFTEFQRIFAEQPDIVAKTSPTDLPESFRVVAKDSADGDAISTRYSDLPGVDTVVSGQGAKSVKLFETNHTDWGCTDTSK
jgi:hypothetical protein